MGIAHQHMYSVMTDTYIDQSKVVFIYGKLFRSNLLFQGRGIGALGGKKKMLCCVVATVIKHTNVDAKHSSSTPVQSPIKTLLCSSFPPQYLPFFQLDFLSAQLFCHLFPASYPPFVHSYTIMYSR